MNENRSRRGTELKEASKFRSIHRQFALCGERFGAVLYGLGKPALKRRTSSILLILLVGVSINVPGGCGGCQVAYEVNEIGQANASVNIIPESSKRSPSQFQELEGPPQGPPPTVLHITWGFDALKYEDTRKRHVSTSTAAMCAGCVSESLTVTDDVIGWRCRVEAVLIEVRLNEREFSALSLF